MNLRSVLYWILTFFILYLLWPLLKWLILFVILAFVALYFFIRRKSKAFEVKWEEVSHPRPNSTMEDQDIIDVEVKKKEVYRDE